MLAYGYDLVGTALTLHLYDPAAGRSRDALLSLANPWARTNVLNRPHVYGFFRVPYARATPPP